MNIDHSLKFFFDHGFTKTDRLFQQFNDQPTDCIDVRANMTDDLCWSYILSDEQMEYIWEEQYFNNTEIFMESPQDVTHSGMSKKTIVSLGEAQFLMVFCPKNLYILYLRNQICSMPFL